MCADKLSMREFHFEIANNYCDIVAKPTVFVYNNYQMNN